MDEPTLTRGRTDDESDAHDLPLTPGAQIGARYTVQAALGTGANGTVYAVTDSLHPERSLALKLAHHDVQLLRNEFGFLTNLQHPNLARVYDFDEHFITMERVASARIESDAIPSYLVQVCRALSYVHSRAIIHFDLKPSNILIDPSGHARIVDFGIAARHESVSNQPWSGTRQYMAPEQLFGGELLDHRADLYALGATLHEWLTGKPPCPAADLDSLERFFEQPFTASVQPAWLGRIVDKLCARDPDQRYRSADEVIAEVNQHVATPFALETSETSRAYITTPRFCGRQMMYERLLAFASGRRDGKTVFVLSGPSGIGKSRLLQQVRHFAQLHSTLFVEGHTAADIDPQLALAQPDAMAIVHFADLQSADEVTTERLRSLARSHPRAALLVTLRNDETLPEHVENCLADLRPLAQLETLGPLDPVHVREVIQSMIGSDALPRELLERVTREADGNPHFTQEIMRVLVENGSLFLREGEWHTAQAVSELQIPRSISEALQRRIDMLEENERDVMALLTASERALSAEQVSMFVPGAKAALRSLRAKTLVMQQPAKTFVPAHPRVADSVRKQLGEEVLRKLQRQVGERLVGPGFFARQELKDKAHPAQQLWANPPAWAAHWPVCVAGVCLAYLGPHVLLLIGEGADAPGFEIYLGELERMIQTAPSSQRGGLVIHIAPNKQWRSMPLSDKRRFLKRWADMQQQHEAKIQSLFAFSATVCPNALARAVIRTVNVLRRSPVPTGIVARPLDAWLALRRVFPELDVTAHVRAHRALAERYVPGAAIE